jgi:HlyD family secretion protein
VQSAEATHAESTARVAEARLAATQARREVERRRPLVDVGALTTEAMEQIELAAEVAERRLAAALAAEEATRAALDGARARLAGGAPGSGEAVAVLAPLAGLVLRIPDRSERIVQAGETLLQLANATGLEVVLEVLTEDAVRMEPGQLLTLTDWGGTAPLTGHIRTITPSGYTKVSALGVEEQRVDVVADLDQVPASLGAEYRVSGEVAVWRGTDVLTVPTSSLFRDGDTWRVFTIENGRALRREVEVGHRSDLSAEVVAGVTEGDTVIAYPPAEVEDGSRVRSGPDRP